eukprot:2317888-Amphidinium_carterae.1
MQALVTAFEAINRELAQIRQAMTTVAALSESHNNFIQEQTSLNAEMASVARNLTAVTTELQDKVGDPVVPQAIVEEDPSDSQGSAQHDRYQIQSPCVGGYTTPPKQCPPAEKEPQSPL